MTPATFKNENLLVFEKAITNKANKSLLNDILKFTVLNINQRAGLGERIVTNCARLTNIQYIIKSWNLYEIHQGSNSQKEKLHK